MYTWHKRSDQYNLPTYLLTVLPLVLLLGLGLPWLGDAASAPTTLRETSADGQITLNSGESLILGVVEVTRVAVAEPKVADVAVVGKTEVLITARSAGDTTLHIWDKTGLSTVSIRVNENTKDLVSELITRINLPGVQAWMRQGTVVLEGWVETSADRQRATQVAAAFGKVVDLLVTKPPAPVPLPPVESDGAEVDAGLAEVRALVNDPGVQLRVVNDTLVISGDVFDAATQERARKAGALYFSQVVDVTQIRRSEQSQWPVEVYRVVDKVVVQVDK